MWRCFASRLGGDSEDADHSFFASRHCRPLCFPLCAPDPLFSFLVFRLPHSRLVLTACIHHVLLSLAPPSNRFFSLASKDTDRDASPNSSCSGRRIVGNYFPQNSGSSVQNNVTRTTLSQYYLTFFFLYVHRTNHDTGWLTPKCPDKEKRVLRKKRKDGREQKKTS